MKIIARARRVLRSSASKAAYDSAVARHPASRQVAIVTFTPTQDAAWTEHLRMSASERADDLAAGCDVPEYPNLTAECERIWSMS
jgi:hypothetical protein